MEQTENLGGAHAPGAPLVPTPMRLLQKWLNTPASSLVSRGHTPFLKRARGGHSHKRHINGCDRGHSVVTGSPKTFGCGHKATEGFFVW